MERLQCWIEYKEPEPTVQDILKFSFEFDKLHTNRHEIMYGLMITVSQYKSFARSLADSFAPLPNFDFNNWIFAGFNFKVILE